MIVFCRRRVHIGGCGQAAPLLPGRAALALHRAGHAVRLPGRVLPGLEPPLAPPLPLPHPLLHRDALPAGVALLARAERTRGGSQARIILCVPLLSHPTRFFGWACK